MPILGILASSRLAYSPVGSYDALASVTVPSGGVSSVTFTGIPSGYRHLEIRILARSNRADVNEQIGVQFNGDTANNYGSHGLWGDGSSATSAQLNYPAGAITLPWIAGNSNSSNVFGVSIVTVLDYASSNKYKTVRGLSGYDNNGNGQAALGSGLWSSTTAVTSVTVKPYYGSLWNQYSSIALYGVK